MAALIIMAGGLGSRYGGGIKQMAGVGPNGEILMEYAVYDALQAGFDRVVVILRPDILDDFRERVGRKLEAQTDLRYALQDFSSLPAWYTLPAGRGKPYGTVHALLCAAEQVTEPFVVINADDYYGAEPFRSVAGVLPELQGTNGVMVAYRLENTVSANGAVTRGICMRTGDKLTALRETHEITLAPDGTIRSDESERADGLLDPASPVSMNLWGFTPAVFEDMEEYFHAFLCTERGQSLKGECLIPEYVGERIAAGRQSIRVLDTDAAWFGMTYAPDREETTRCLRQLHAQGAYPLKLFPEKN